MFRSNKILVTIFFHILLFASMFIRPPTMSSEIQGTDKTECVVCWDDIAMSTTDRFQCTQCEHRVCPACLLKLNNDGVCTYHKCLHVKCPVCRKPDNIDYQHIERIVLTSKSGEATLGVRRFKRKIEQVDGDISVVSVERYRRTFGSVSVTVPSFEEFMSFLDALGENVPGTVN